MLASEFGTGQVFWSFLWFTLFFIWIWLLITVFADIFRSHDLGGFAKFLWVMFVILLPYLGVFVYLIARGHKMSEHAIADAQAQDAGGQGVHPPGRRHRRDRRRRRARAAGRPPRQRRDLPGGVRGPEGQGPRQLTSHSLTPEPALRVPGSARSRSSSRRRSR